MENKLTIITAEDIRKRSQGLTIKDIKKFIEKNNPSDDAFILIERVKDSYYEGSDISGMGGCKDTKDGIYPEGSRAKGWGVYLKKSEFYYNQLDFNKRMRTELERRAKGEEPDYPKIEDPNKYIIENEAVLDELKTQYCPASFIMKYPDDEFVYINLHY